MKIVDRKTFLAMPEGTVYCKIQFRDPLPTERAVQSMVWIHPSASKAQISREKHVVMTSYAVDLALNIQKKATTSMYYMTSATTSAKRFRLKWLAVVTASSTIRIYTLPSTHAKRCKK